MNFQVTRPSVPTKRTALNCCFDHQDHQSRDLPIIGKVIGETLSFLSVPGVDFNGDPRDDSAEVA